MSLYNFLLDRLEDHATITLPLRVVGNGYKTSNVPAGAMGTVLSVNEGEAEFDIQFDGCEIVETF